MFITSKNLKVDGERHFLRPLHMVHFMSCQFKVLELLQGSGGHQLQSSKTTHVVANFKEMVIGHHAGISMRTKKLHQTPIFHYFNQFLETRATSI
jgi:hypothetical protein